MDSEPPRPPQLPQDPSPPVILEAAFHRYTEVLRSTLLLVALSLLAGCVKYRPKPLEPPRLEQEYRARSHSSPSLRSYIEANASVKPSQWPPASLDLATLTLVAFYYNPDLDTARARVAAAEAGILTAKGRPNPSLSVGGGWTNSPESAFIFHFDPGFLIETAGKRGHRILQAQRQAEVARLEFAETGWSIRSRLRSALLDHWMARRVSELLAAEEQVRAQAVRLLEQRLAAGEVSRPDVDLAAADWNTAKVALASAQGRVAETLVALAAAAGLPVRSLEGIGIDWPEFDQPPSAGTLPLASVQTAGLLHRLDVRRALLQ